MADLTDPLQREIDERFSVAESRQVMRVAELSGVDRALPPAAHGYGEGPNHVGPSRRIRGGLGQHISRDYTDATLSSVTRWGRYAEIFAFREVTARLSSDDPG